MLGKAILHAPNACFSAVSRGYSEELNHQPNTATSPPERLTWLSNLKGFEMC